MYVFMFFVVLGVITYITNRSNEVESSQEFLRWSQKDIIIIGLTFLLSILMQILDAIFLPWFFLFVYIVAATLSLLYVNKNREKTIIEYKKQIDQIVDSLANLCPAKEVEYNNLPFEIEKDGDLISKIIVIMKEPSKFKDASCTNAVYSLKRYFPYFDWKYTCDFPKQECVFEGMKLPPDIAKWPGSDLRKSYYMPVGLSGEGEVAWSIKNTSKNGNSMYEYDDGGRAGDVNLSSAPHLLVLGATGGGKAIWTDQEIW